MLKQNNPRTALVACSRLVDFAGAEIASLEIAETLRDLGIQVKMAALEIGSVVASEIKLAGIECIDLSVDNISGEEFDLIWVSHYVVAYHLLVKECLRAKIGIFSSLSHFEPIETPPLPLLFFSRYTVNSEENLLHFEAHYPTFKDRVGIFPNASPVGFFNIYREPVDCLLVSIAVISNHPPIEVGELIVHLQKQGIKVDLIGIQGKILRVTPKVLCKYSAVITIGKTVQYCLAAGIPVFCYDHFGGPGWITLKSFKSAFVNNFSGRCTPTRRTSDCIAHEMFSGYPSVVVQREDLRDLARTHFDLVKNLVGILNIASESPLLISLSKTENHVLSRESSLFLSQRQVIANIHHALAERDVKIADLAQALSEGGGKIAQLAHALTARDGKITDLAHALAERDGKITGLTHALAERDGKITDLAHAVAERDGKITGLTHALAERDGKITDLAHALAERDGKITGLTHAFAEREDALALSRRELSSVLTSTSWKMTDPMRRLIISARLIKANFKSSVARAVFVIRHEGILVFSRSTIELVRRYQQRKSATKQLERFKRNSETVADDRKFPLVSFVIPIYDRTDVLRTSINSALEQSLQVFEVILVTDGSPSDTLAVVEEYRFDPRIKIFNYPVSSGNAVRGRNKGILEARGRYIAFLDSDDAASHYRLEVCLPILESGQADVIYGGWRAMLDGTRDIDGLIHGQEVYSPDCDFEILKRVCVPCQSTVMVRRELLLRSGFLKPRMQYREDHELWLRLAHRGAKFKSVPYVLTDLRLHSGNNELNFKSNDIHWANLLSEEYVIPGLVPKKICFFLAGLGISGGAAVVLKHVSMLMQAGHDAFVIDLGGYGDISWFGNPAIRVYRMEKIPDCGLDNIDLLFATFWTTVPWLEKISAKRKLYLVQSDERLFYEADVVKAQIADTYRQGYEYVVIAQWLVDMLYNEFGKLATYVPNGLDIGLFYPGDPLEAKDSQRLRVLIEGPISVPFKGMVEAYAAVSELDCELWIVSTSGKPERGWRYDRFFEGVNQAEMRRIYSSCDVLLKMSRVESFAYPPLEAMACGCAVVLGEVNGGIEYARDGENILRVPQGDVLAARAAVQQLLTNAGLRESLTQAGFKTVKCWNWENSRQSMFTLIDDAKGP